MRPESRGAKASLLAAVELEPRVQGVVSLSAEASLQGKDVVGPTARLDLPLLVVTAKDDQYGSNVVGPQLMAAARSRDRGSSPSPARTTDRTCSPAPPPARSYRP